MEPLPPLASEAFLQWFHRAFYQGSAEAMLTISAEGRQFRMEPAAWRNRPEHDVAVGRHLPPSSERVADFMAHFESRFRFDRMGTAARIMAMASAHRRFNYIHLLPDGNGRVSRLMSHAMASVAGIGAHGLWSVSRALARGLEGRGDYKVMMDYADKPRRGDLDGRGNLSVDEALIRGEFERGEAAGITGLPERTARRGLADAVDLGLLASDTPKGKISLRFPAHALEDLFPRLYSRS